MIKNILLIALVIGLIVSLLSTSTLSKTLIVSKNRNNELQAELNGCEYINDRIDMRSTMCILSENKKLNNTDLINSDLDTVRLSDIVKETKLVYRFYEGTCVQCVEDELDIIRQLGDSIGINKIIIISDFHQVNNMKGIIDRKQIKSPSFVCENKFDLPIEEDEVEVASFFLLDEDLITHSVYKAGGGQTIGKPYYKSIVNFFNSK